MPIKAAFCFLISSGHCLNKEQLWVDWIEPNKDIINVYFHYDDISKIESEWILKHAIPQKNIVPTSYMHVVPAYITLMAYASKQCTMNRWFIMLTESCVPIISPERFRRLFFEGYSYSILSWKKAWWNVEMHKRANLRMFKEEFRLANDPWFVLKREDLHNCLQYIYFNSKLYNTICEGGLANESIFAIMLYTCGKLNDVKKSVSTAADWTRMTSSTSPHLFKDGNHRDIVFIDKFLLENKDTMFLRKVDKSFPDSILQKYTSTILLEDKSSFQKYNNINYCEMFFWCMLIVSPIWYFIFIPDCITNAP